MADCSNSDEKKVPAIKFVHRDGKPYYQLNFAAVDGETLAKAREVFKRKFPAVSDDRIQESWMGDRGPDHASISLLLTSDQFLNWVTSDDFMKE
jgi:hypothetical protein